MRKAPRIRLNSGQRVSKSAKWFQSDALGPFFWQKRDFPGDFSEVKSHDVGEFVLCAFRAVLISNRLKIICKVLGEIYTPGG